MMSPTSMSTADFVQDGPLPSGLTVIEASAGTGKTHALTTLVVRFLAETEISAAQLLVVSFTEATTAELRARVRARLVDTGDRLERIISGTGDTDDPDPVVAAIAAAEPEIRLARIRRAVTELDAASISTIHGFCSRVLAGRTAEFGTLGSGTDAVVEASLDRLVAEAADDPGFEVPLGRLASAVTLRMSMPRAGLFTGDPLSKKVGPAQAKVIETMVRLEPVLDGIVADVRERRRRTATRTFDSLITDTLELLDGPHGPEVVHALRDRYRVVLIDEFQDTDQVQWEIFETAFVAPGRGLEATATMVIVGDPKQSIYRFRSAELNAYLQAVDTAGSQTMSLRTNWRSDQALLDSLDRLFTGFHFGDPRVGFIPVAAPPHRHESGIDLGGTPSPPLQIRFIAGAPGHHHIDSAGARQAVRVDVVATVAGLLDGTTRIIDDAVAGDVEVDGGDGYWRALERRDIAILTRSNADAVAIARSLSAVGIAAATSSNDSVLASDAAMHWKILLQALERPGRSGTARTAALGWFFDIAPADLAVWSDDDHAGFHDELHRWARDLNDGGLPALLARITACGVHERLLRRPNGERDLTDLDHIAELLQREIGDRHGGAAGALVRLRELASSAALDESAKELLSRRIDRDDDAVRVMTVHKAKGLEFPIVLVPYLWRTGTSDGIPHAVIDGQRHIDLTWVGGAGNTALNKRLRDLVSAEVAGEDTRLLYVALTRARHRTIAWWAAPYTGANPLTATGKAAAIRSAASPFGVLLAHHLGRVPDRSSPMRVLEDTGAIEIVDVEPRQRVDPSIAERFATDGVRDDGVLDVARWDRVIDTDWRIWSFTRLAAAVTAADPDRHRVVGDPALADTGDPMGGTDEAVPGADPDPGPDVDEEPPTPLADAPAGAAFGTAVHQILERADFTVEPLVDELEIHCREILRFRPLSIEPERLAVGLAHALSAPLGGPAGDLRLIDLDRTDRLDELTFDLPLARLTAAEIGATLAADLADDDPLRPWAERWAGRPAGSGDIALSGWLTGSIDLTARIGPSTDRRYVVADYKTNRLGRRSAYEPDRLVAAMEHHDYPLQATLYLVALHRYLNLRLPGYDPDTHLGGAAYVFVRGMEPDSPGHGVMWWQPRSAAIIAVDRLLARGGGR